jgi:hypothetical protein
LINSNQVFMPNVLSSKLGFGYRKNDLIIEGIIDTWNTLGGFDIRKNDMPFPSNRMNMTRGGINLKIPIKKVSGLSFIANSFYTLLGRNVGQSLSGTIGVFYVYNVKSETTAEAPIVEPLVPTQTPIQEPTIPATPVTPTTPETQQ